MVSAAARPRRLEARTFSRTSRDSRWTSTYRSTSDASPTASAQRQREPLDANASNVNVFMAVDSDAGP